MQASVKRAAGALVLLATCAAFSAPGPAATAYVTNEKGNSITVLDLDRLEVVRTVKVGQRPRGIALSKDQTELFVCLGDDDTIAVLDAKALNQVGELPSGPDPEQLRVSPDGRLVFIANENDALLTVIDIATRKVVSEFPVGVEPEGVAVSPDGAIVVNTSETTSMAHLIDWRNKKVVANILVGSRPRYAEYNRDGSELWVSSEVGGSVSVIDPVKHVIASKISFDVPGLAKEQIQPVGIRFSPDGKLAFVALGPANRVAVIDAASKQVLKYLACRPTGLAIGSLAGRQSPRVDQWRFERRVGNRLGVAEGRQVDCGRLLPMGRRDRRALTANSASAFRNWMESATPRPAHVAVCRGGPGWGGALTSGPTGPQLELGRRPPPDRRFGISWPVADCARAHSVLLGFSAWNWLDFLGFSRPNRDFSTGYGAYASKSFFEVLSRN